MYYNFKLIFDRKSANFVRAGLTNSAFEPKFATKTAEQRIVRNLIFIVSIDM